MNSALSGKLLQLLLPLLAAGAVCAADAARNYTDAEFAVNEGSWMSVDVSPDGKTLVFDLLGDIYRLPAGGGEATLLHGGPAMQRAPSFSADGGHLLYLSDASGADNVWMSGADGSAARQVTRETTDIITGPAWGPDGTVVAAKTRAHVATMHASELRLFDLRGGSGRLLVPAPANGENVHEAQFSRDGRYLYYTEKISAPTASVVYVDANHINFAIKRRDMRSGATEQLLSGFGSATTPTLSPDGKRLAFVRRVKSKTELFVYDLTSGEQRPVYDALERDGQSDFLGQGTYYPHFAWFPDNRHVAIWARGKLHRIDMQTGAETPIPFHAVVRQRIAAAPRFGHDLEPDHFTVRAIRQLAVAPDGRSIVFNALGHLWRKDLPDGKPQRLTDAVALEFEPAYAPDGRHVIYVEWNDEHGGALKRVSVRGGRAQTLFTTPGVLRQPAFSADGKHIVYKIDAGDQCMGGQHGRAGLYWMDAGGGEPHRLAAAGDAPQFAPDGQRVYFTTLEYQGERAIHKLESVNLGGFDRREHAHTLDTDTLELKLSPDRRWIAFRERQQYYVAPYRELGLSMAVSATGGAVPVARLTAAGGYDLTWSADSRTLHWTLGPGLYQVAVAPYAAAAAPQAPRPYAEIGLQAASDVPDGALAITHARIITMRGEEVIERGTLVVERNRIAAVGPDDAVAIPAGARVIDATGKTLMPGLVDMHGHLEDCYYSSAGLMPQKQPSHYAQLAFGVTTNYDPYTSELPAYSVSEMNRAGVMVGPRSIVSGSVIFGRVGKTDYTYVPIDSLEDARNVMRRKLALGGTIIKSYRQPARRQRQWLVEAGRELGIMADVEGESHFYDNITMILDGHTALEHNMPIANYYDDVVQLMARGHTAHTPTLIVAFGELMGENYFYQNTRAWEDPKVRRYVQKTTSGYSPLGIPYGAPPYARNMTTIHVVDELWDIGFRSVARSVKKLDDAGVWVNAGSHGQIHGIGEHWEMWLMAQGGMSNLHVLRAATLNGARTLGLDGQIGSLEAGKLADLLVLDRNPLENIRNTNSVRYAMVNGRLYDTLTMNEIGNYDRPRSRFYWELGDEHGIDWNESWAHQ